LDLKTKKTISLRNLSRALNYINANRDFYGQRAIYDGLVLGFGEKAALEKYDCKLPPAIEREGYAIIQGFWVKKGSHPTLSTE
jgi:hypothetical protein